MNFKSDKKGQFYTAKTKEYHYKISTIFGDYRCYYMKNGIGTQIGLFENLEKSKIACENHNSINLLSVL
jgi:hypothetical protein